MKLPPLICAVLATLTSASGQWIPEQVPAGANLLLTLDFFDDAAGISGGWGFNGDVHGRAIFSPDGGKTWLPASIPDSTRAMVTMISISETLAYAAGARNTGEAFPLPSHGRQIQVPHMSRGMQVYRNAIGMTGTEGYRGAFMRSTDGGKHWHSFGTLPDGTFYLLGMCVTAQTTIFATAAGSSSAGTGRIIKSVDGGLTWALRHPGVAGEYKSIEFMDCLSGVAVGQASGGSSSVGAIARTSDGGDSWEEVQLFPAVDNFAGVSFPTSLTGYVVGFDPLTVSSRVYKTTDGGTVWTALPFSADSVLAQSILFLDGTDIGYVFGDVLGADSAGFPGQWHPYIAKTTDGGSTWARSEITGDHPNKLLVGGTFISPEETFACGGDPSGPAVMLHTTNGGVSAVGPETAGFPSGLRLLGNYPNPFNPLTTITFSLPPQHGSVGTLHATSLQVFDVLGRRVASLVDEPMSPGIHATTFDASQLPSGTYIYRLISGNFAAAKKMMLLR
jgi:photosystem II stability/assembly factor-like uncharacterized protein